MDNEELKERLKRLEEEKMKLIERAKKVNRRYRYKTMELKAIEPYVKATENVKTGPVKAKLRRLEFKISTQAYTPRREKEILKRIKGLEEDIEKALKIERARRKMALIEKDIAELSKEKEEVDKALSAIREEINSVRNKLKESRKITGKAQITQVDTEPYFSLKEVVEIKKKKKE